MTKSHSVVAIVCHLLLKSVNSIAASKYLISTIPDQKVCDIEPTLLTNKTSEAETES